MLVVTRKYHLEATNKAMLIILNDQRYRQIIQSHQVDGSKAILWSLLVTRALTHRYWQSSAVVSKKTTHSMLEMKTANGEGISIKLVSILTNA